MYPFIRMAYQIAKHRKDAPLPLDGVHVSRHICWPWDLDIWMELNNGRTLTLFDLGRVPFIQRLGLVKAIRGRKWGLTVAGSSVRYRRRIVAFERLEMRTRMVGRDARFFYIQQSLWKGDEAASSLLLRAAVTSKNGIVPTDDVATEMGAPEWDPEMPDWVQKWITSEGLRAWPPEV